jgi:hypothetical protein
MASNSLNIQSMLAASFTKAERAFLDSVPAFVDRVEKTNTADDYENLCEMCEELLKSEPRKLLA